MNNDSIRTGALRGAVLAAVLLLAACGGGGGNPNAVNVGGGNSGSTGGSTGGTGGTGTAVTAAPAVTLGLTNGSGASTTALTGATPLTVKATVLDADKKPVPNAIVAFATDNALAVFTPSAGTALTDASGVASVTMRAASLGAGGAGTVTATTAVAGATVVGTVNYAVGATTLALGPLSAAQAKLQAYDSTVLSVDLLAGSARYLDQPVDVTFSSACAAAGKATLATTVATNNGVAQTVYRDKGCGNNDVVTVSADGVAKPVSTTLSIAPPGASSVQFVSAAPLNQSIVIRGQGGNGRTETATLTFRVFDTFGNPLAGRRVDFTPSTAAVSLNKLSDTTDAAGNVITTVNSGTVPTSFRVRATLPNTAANGNPDISTMSDSLVVTTGLPVQRAFSLSVGTFNVEGWNYDSSPDKPATRLQALLADDFGNPVPDGTPVVFQTNMGSVGSADRGGCLTVNGGCSVDLRTQNPRVPTLGTPATPCNAATQDSARQGLATICASSTDGTNTVFARAMVFFSGPGATSIYLDGKPLVAVPRDGYVFPSIRSDETLTFTLQFNDLNNNPLPAGSLVEVASMKNGVAAPPLPATVPNIAPLGSAADESPVVAVGKDRQGSTHTFRISSLTPSGCTARSEASFSVTVTTPSGLVTSIPFKLSFTCP